MHTGKPFTKELMQTLKENFDKILDSFGVNTVEFCALSVYKRILNAVCKGELRISTISGNTVITLTNDMFCRYAGGISKNTALKFIKWLSENQYLRRINQGYIGAAQYAFTFNQVINNALEECEVVPLPEKEASLEKKGADNGYASCRGSISGNILNNNIYNQSLSNFPNFTQIVPEEKPLQVEENNINTSILRQILNHGSLVYDYPEYCINKLESVILHFFEKPDEEVFYIKGIRYIAGNVKNLLLQNLSEDVVKPILHYFKTHSLAFVRSDNYFIQALMNEIRRLQMLNKQYLLRYGCLY